LIREPNVTPEWLANARDYKCFPPFTAN
jgi:hypothetical protein